MVRSNTGKLQRVTWRLKEMKPFIAPDIYSNNQIHLAIMEEIGTSDRTVKTITKQMKRLKLIKPNELSTWKIVSEKEREIKIYGEKQQKLGTMKQNSNESLPPA